MKIRDVATVIEEFAPLQLQETYDNSGLNIGFPDAELTGVLICVDVTETVVDEAIGHRANLIVSHHPLLFHPLRRIVGADASQRIAARCLIAGISLYAAHTNLDSADGGYEFPARAIARTAKYADAETESGNSSRIGVRHRRGTARQSAPDAGVSARDQTTVKLRRDPLQRPVPRNRLTHSAVHRSRSFDDRRRRAAGADLYLSSDLKYNDFYTPDGRIVAADVGHFESEYCAIALFA